VNPPGVKARLVVWCWRGARCGAPSALVVLPVTGLGSGAGPELVLDRR